ncbi:hypothetical protein [Rhizobium leguminosarum]|uniref:hypothetical protein n=1 Tax=Rhizobium leguminosarum TaxID=384 RepID=UPI002E11C9F5|nr:hypothetical protein U8Q02_37855 [Rhizobium leguminosarum]
MSTAARGMLADKVQRFARDAIGAPEHAQIAELVGSAKRHRLSREAALAIRRKLYDDPATFERNLDVLTRPEGPEWYEWPLETRAGHGGGDRAVTGCLVLPHPDAETVLTFVTGWVGDKAIARHSYGTAMVDVGDLAKHAFEAREFYSSTPGESVERVMEQIGVAVPLGFQDEIAIMFDRSEAAMEAVLRDASSEIPYMLAVLVTMRCEGGLVGNEGQGCTELTFGPTREPGIGRRIGDVLRGGRRPFIRRIKARDGTTTLRWEPEPRRSR